jgi:methionine aminotransferase
MPLTPIYDRPFTGKLNHVESSIFSKMSALAQKHNALNLSQGFPDFEVDAKLIELVHYYMRQGFNQYAPMAGALSLRNAICHFSQDLYGASYNPETEITITAGATQAIATVLSTCIEPEDEVILFSPAYDCYRPMVALNGGIPVSIELEYPSYGINWQALKDALNQRTKMIIVNTPHNPSGSVLKQEDLDQLASLLSGTKTFVLADEVYEHIVFNGAKHLSIRSHAELAARSFVVGSLGKSLHVTGWKIGYCLAPEALMKEFHKVHQFQIFATNHPIQLAIADYLNAADLRAIGGFYESKQQIFEKALEPTGFKALPTFGSYFQLASYSALSDESEVDFAIRLTKEYGVAAIPISPFYPVPTNHQVLRFCFAKNEETLRKAGLQLQKVG